MYILIAFGRDTDNKHTIQYFQIQFGVIIVYKYTQTWESWTLWTIVLTLLYSFQFKSFNNS